MQERQISSRKVLDAFETCKVPCDIKHYYNTPFMERLFTDMSFVRLHICEEQPL